MLMIISIYHYTILLLFQLKGNDVLVTYSNISKVFENSLLF